MAFPLSSWRTSAFAGFLALLSLGTACHKGNDNNPSSAGTITLSGTLNYTRIPLLTDPVTGIPTGLEGDTTKFVKSPARGISVRVYQEIESTNFEGTTYKSWVAQGATNTNSTGYYSVTVASGYKTFVEVISSAIYYDATGAKAGQINVFAEPDGIDATAIEPNRLVYALRKGADGTLQTDPLVLPGSMAGANATINFDIGLNDPWCVTPRKDVWTDTLLKDATNIQIEGSAYARNPNSPGTGSRVLAILDSGYTFSKIFGNPSPSGYALDLHYFYNCNTTQPQPRFSYVDRDLNTYPQRLPQAFDGSTYRYFGHVQGGTQSDDAFDEGVLFPIFCGDKLMFEGAISLAPVLTPNPWDPQYLQSQQDLRPDLALLDGLAPAMAAALLKSPYLADTTGQPGGGLNPLKGYRDIRDLTGVKKDAFSAPALSSLAWDVILKAGSVTAPGTPAQWTAMDPAGAARFFTISSSFDTGGLINDISNIYHQLARLQETYVSGEIIDLAKIFTDAELGSLLTPYNIPWPRPTAATAPNSPYITFMPFWEMDPNSLVKPLPALTLSMAYARQNTLGQYSNVSWGVEDPIHPGLPKGEVFTGIFNISKDTVYDLSLNTSPAIPASATVEVSLGAPNITGAPSFASGTTYAFGASSPTQHYRITLGMPGIALTNRAYYPIMVRLKSPTVLQPSDLTVTVNLVPTR